MCGRIDNKKHNATNIKIITECGPLLMNSHTL